MKRGGEGERRVGIAHVVKMPMMGQTDNGEER
jgi:hypothetical protein